MDVQRFQPRSSRLSTRAITARVAAKAPSQFVRLIEANITAAVKNRTAVGRFTTRSKAMIPSGIRTKDARCGLSPYTTKACRRRGPQTVPRSAAMEGNKNIDGESNEYASPATKLTTRSLDR